MSKKLGATIDNNINVQVAKKRGRKSKKEIEEAQKNTSKIEENIFVKIEENEQQNNHHNMSCVKEIINSDNELVDEVLDELDNDIQICQPISSEKPLARVFVNK